MKRKKILGIILSIVFSAIFFGVLVIAKGLKPTLIAVGTTAVIVSAVGLCINLLMED
jgi:membrane protease YdiL (CAAX protease family)